MSRRIIDTGRVEVKGAELRFKQKGTLEAFDRNVADLERVYVRSTPSPDIRLFTDFVFAGDVFRVWQDSTLINYKDFLEKVEMAGLENYRGFLRYTTRAAGPELLDPTSRSFAESNAPPERFVNKDELSDYDRALTRGDAAAPARGAAKTATRVSNETNTAAKRAVIEQAWNEMAPQLAEEEQAGRQDSANLVPMAGMLLVFLGTAIALFVIRAFRTALAVERARDMDSTSKGVFVVGGLVALAFLVMGGLYLVRASRAKKPTIPSSR